MPSSQLTDVGAVPTVSRGGPVNEYRYITYAFDYGEPYLLSRAVKAATEARLSFSTLTFKPWWAHRRALATQTFCTIWSTHGVSPANPRNESGEWEFGNLERDHRGHERWRTISEDLGEKFRFGAEILIVLACHAEQVQWTNYVRPGTTVVAAKGEVTQRQCATPLARYLRSASDPSGPPPTTDALVACWGDNFDIVRT